MKLTICHAKVTTVSSLPHASYKYKLRWRLPSFLAATTVWVLACDISHHPLSHSSCFFSKPKIKNVQFSLKHRIVVVQLSNYGTNPVYFLHRTLIECPTNKRKHQETKKILFISNVDISRIPLKNIFSYIKFKKPIHLKFTFSESLVLSQPLFLLNHYSVFIEERWQEKDV